MSLSDRGKEKKKIEESKIKEWVIGFVQFILYPIFFTYTVFLVAENIFDLKFSENAIFYELFLLFIYFSFLVLILRKKSSVVVGSLGFLIIIYIPNFLKLSFLGGPILPQDLKTFSELLLILDFKYVLSIVALFTFLIFSYVFVFKRKIVFVLVYYFLIACLVFVYGTEFGDAVRKADKHLGYVAWDQPQNFKTMGPSLYTIQSFSRFFSQVGTVPSSEDVRKAARYLDIKTAPTPEPEVPSQRNVYIIVAESFWDPSELGADLFSSEVLHKDFIELWKQAQFSKVLSPVFAGVTANAEYELLCGQPADFLPGVAFQDSLKNDMPCLPDYLSRSGYLTVAAHPNTPSFWNRSNAYNFLGFKEFLSKKDFVIDDKNGSFLSDISFFKQTLEKTQNIKKPFLLYMLTISGHYSYPLNESLRPKFIDIKHENEDLYNYANSLYYTSKEISEAIKIIYSFDENPVIVVLGDHLPHLGLNFSTYRNLDYFKDDVNEYSPDMYRKMVSAPLLIIDGDEVVRDLGEINMYEVPAVLSEILSVPAPKVFQFSQEFNGMKVRSLPYTHKTLLYTSSSSDICPDEKNPSCDGLIDFTRSVKTITQDLAIGKQHFLDM